MIRPRQRKSEPTQAFIERASKEYFAAGLHIVEIAKKLEPYGADMLTVFNAIVPTARITTEAERDAMISMRDAGYSVAEIAKLTNRSRSCVRKRLYSKAETAISKDCNNMLTTEQIDEMRRMYLEEGMCSTAIAKHFGITRGSALYRLKKMGIYEPGRNVTRGVTKTEVAKMKRMSKRGLTYTEIGKRTGHTRETVSLYVRGIRKASK